MLYEWKLYVAYNKNSPKYVDFKYLQIKKCTNDKNV